MTSCYGQLHHWAVRVVTRGTAPPLQLPRGAAYTFRILTKQNLGLTWHRYSFGVQHTMNFLTKCWIHFQNQLYVIQLSIIVLQTGHRLPSVFHLNGHRSAPPPPKRRRSAAPKQKISNKNIICLLGGADSTTPRPIPRGENRACLTEAGLTGKIAINSTWGALDVQYEISNLFGSSFGLSIGEVLPFKYLRYCTLPSFCYDNKSTNYNAICQLLLYTSYLFSTMPGGKKLCIPRTSPSFVWNATEVISTAAQGSLYIMATIPPLRTIKRESAVSCHSILLHFLPFIIHEHFKTISCKITNVYT